MTLAEALFIKFQMRSLELNMTSSDAATRENACRALKAARIFKEEQEEDDKKDRPESGGEALVPG